MLACPTIVWCPDDVEGAPKTQRPSLFERIAEWVRGEQDDSPSNEWVPAGMSRPDGPALRIFSNEETAHGEWAALQDLDATSLLVRSRLSLETKG